MQLPPLSRFHLSQILFLDIETVPLYADYSSLSEVEKQLWEEKTRYQRQENFTAEEFYTRAGIWAEFGKIVCISVGYFSLKTGVPEFRVRSFTGDEVTILEEFSSLLVRFFRKYNRFLCAHNGKEFDFPFIARRILIHGLPLPEALNLFGKKPWEIPHIDTMELWKFGDYKHYVSLALLAHSLGIPTPKDDISGADVARVFYQENDIERIQIYCQKDVITLAKIFLRMRGDAPFNDTDIKYVTQY